MGLPYFYWYYNYGNYMRLENDTSTPKTYTVYIYFYTGDDKNTYDLTLDDGTKKSVSISKSVKKVFGINTATGDINTGDNFSISENALDTLWELDSVKITMAQYAAKIWEHLLQFTIFDADWGLNFVPENGDTSAYRTFTKSSDVITSDYTGNIYIYNPYAGLGINGVYRGYPNTQIGKTFYINSVLLKHSDNGGKESGVGDIGKFYSGGYYNIREVILHEFAHCLGWGHPFDSNGYSGIPIAQSKSFNTNYNSYFTFGNLSRMQMPAYKGFIHPGGVTEGTLNTLDIIYNNTTTSAIINGSITGNNTTVNNRFKDGFGVAYLIDGHKKECMYSSPIDRNGDFKFRLRIIPPSTVNYYVLITSAEFNTHFVQQEKKGKTNVLRPIKRRDDNTFETILDTDNFDGYAFEEYGKIYYATKNIGAIATGTTTITINPTTGSSGDGYSADTVLELEGLISSYVNYTGANTFSVTKLSGKYYLCAKTHTSKTGDNGNKPKIGKKWKKYWVKSPSKYESDATEWKKDTKYYGDFSYSEDSKKKLGCMSD